MKHDHLCEYGQQCRTCETSAIVKHCHCGSRAFPLCMGCRGGNHLQHTPTNPGTGKSCCCDLCEVAA